MVDANNATAKVLIDTALFAMGGWGGLKAFGASGRVVTTSGKLFGSGLTGAKSVADAYAKVALKITEKVADELVGGKTGKAGSTLYKTIDKIESATHGRLFEPPNDEQLAWRPSPTAHSIGWTLWHSARADDNFQRDLTGRSIWKEGGYGQRWGHSDRMNLMEDSAAAAMPMPLKEELLGYVRAVFAAIEVIESTLDEARFAEEIESGFLGRRAPIGVAYLVAFGHDGRHLGEMEYIKGLQGLAGTVTV